MPSPLTPSAAFFEYLKAHMARYGYNEVAGTTDRAVSLYDFAAAYPSIPIGKIITTNGCAWARPSVRLFRDLVVEIIKGRRLDGSTEVAPEISAGR